MATHSTSPARETNTATRETNSATTPAPGVPGERGVERESGREREALRDALATPERKHRYVARLFDTIAPRYDFITRLLSYGRDRQWKRRMIALAAIAPRERVLDLACGTGDLAFAAAERGADVIGLDFTPRMIHLARLRPESRPASSDRATASARFLVGDMMALPIPDASVDVITTGYGLRNVPGLAESIAEIHRVLRPGGRFF